MYYASYWFRVAICSIVTRLEVGFRPNQGVSTLREQSMSGNGGGGGRDGATECIYQDLSSYWLE